MFAKAILEVGNYTRPIMTIAREYKSENVIPSAATMFFVNDEGCAVTCKHVAELIVEAENINAQYINFKREIASLPNDSHLKNAYRNLEQEYNYHSGITVEMKHNFVDCVDTVSNIDCFFHPKYDLAIIKFHGFSHVLYKGHAVLAENGNAVQPGDFMCRLGYPFPEFTNYHYDTENDQITWDSNGLRTTPRFPIEGMITRHIVGNDREVMGFELSTPGLRGQSGGPLFDKDGVIYGMQSMTNHLYLGFDMNNQNMVIHGKQQTVNNQPFLHVGHCIHVEIIKAFLNEHNVKYYTGSSIEEQTEVN